MSFDRPVLGIESSCDETAVAIVGPQFEVLSSVVASQMEHARFGGVVPEIASRQHLATILPVLEEALGEAGVRWQELGGIAVARGPGLIGCLLVGVQVAKSLAWVFDKPVVGVNHLHAHTLAICLDASEVPEPPYIVLLVSGGHTALYRVDGLMELICLGQTRDDAAGEAIDKFARLVGLPYPGGAAVDALAARGDREAVSFPRAMRGRGLDFSFSGLKTAARNHVLEFGRPTAGDGLEDLCASYQEAVVEILVEKALLACAEHKAKHLVLAGGVAANSRLRELGLAQGLRQGVALVAPPRRYCTDNAAMIAAAGLCELARSPAGHGLGMDATATWPIASP